jgi:tetratricopeptide (TPR) repeat protein/serine/threonine protein kinase
MSDTGRNVKVIFGEALDYASPAEQAAYLDRACGGDPALRARVEALLHAHQRAGHFLQGPPAPAERGPAEAPGTVLGPYRLLEPIGEGGFGIVYRAEQQQPVRRRVALKVLRPGMAGRQVVARFEAERQALALMNHPNIARVLDAGEAPPAYAGGPPRPYFVMELVEGVPLTDFCDRERLTPRERLGLFTSVCQAVQHAHQKGIIHRDLKPANVLVAVADDPLTLPSPRGGEGRVRGVVKVIDFGVAKALEQRLTDKTLVTGVAQVIGTPLYMSPEQAEPGAVDIDTRSDIYALGVLLYELLTGTTPFDRERLSKASFDELRRIIREEEPPRPSTRVSTLGPAALTLSEQRRTDPRHLGQLLRGELDWVVMKCLEKDRTRRYQTADALARDVARYLADEPVEACPPSAGYRLGKFLRKHRRPLVTAAAFLVLLLVAGAATSLQTVRLAQAERDQVVQQAVRSREVHAALARAAALRDQARATGDAGQWMKAREEARGAEALVEGGPVEPGLAERVVVLRRALDEEQADRQLAARLEEIRLLQAEVNVEEGRFARERALPEYRQAFAEYGLRPAAMAPADAVALLGRRPAVRDPVVAALDEWLDLARREKAAEVGWLERVLAVADPDDWRQRLRVARGRWDRQALEDLAREVKVAAQPPLALCRLVSALRGFGSAAGALALLRRAREEYPGDFWINHHLGLTLLEVQPPRPDEAIRFLTAAVALRPGSPGSHLNLGLALAAGGQLDEAIACYHKALILNAKYAEVHNNLGVALADKGQLDEAIAGYRKAIEIDPKHARAHYNLGHALEKKGQLDEAIAYLRKACVLDSKLAPAHNNLGMALVKKDQWDDAVACFKKAIALDLKSALAHTNLGTALAGKGQPHEAIAYFKKAITLDPKFAKAHNNLGTALAGMGQVDKALACFQQAIEFDPKLAVAHCNLGMVLRDKDRVDEAIECYRKAIELDPKLAAAHCNLGMVLRDKDRVDEAIECYRKAIELDPKNPVPPTDLGAILCDVKRDYDGAIACFRQAVALKPKDANAHCNLGIALAGKRAVDKAIECYRKAIELDPKFVPAHNNLGFALDAAGKQKEAIEAWRTAVRLEPRLAMTHYWLGKALLLQGRPGEALVPLNEAAERLSPEQVGALGLPAELSRAERLSRLEKRQPDLLAGKDRLGDNRERLDLIDLCRGQHRFAAAARFFTEAFAAEAKLADDLTAAHRYNAACSAALAAAGQGEDAGKLEAGERAQLRMRALDWLRADLTLLGKQVDSGQPGARATLQQKLRHWQQDRALAGIRDQTALNQLPVQEQKAFAQLWSDVAALLAKTAGSPI